ncbi:MAG: SUMF1/EgtB/PvdO family nonheme iron enzyme [Candidatus Hydrogenedentes bacterium]|nr:SUMF1/EgtB/PvdO family nonheme iron enzyme [Candidatus Hydrogenedentota bacterium]
MKRCSLPVVATTLCALILRAGFDANAADEPARPGETWTITLPGGVPMELVFLAPGTFPMGESANEKDAYPNKETPQHLVQISKGFWMGKYEITKAQWLALMGTTPWKDRLYVSEDANTPAVYVSWNDAQAFTAELAEATGKPFRLPTEAEWEFACRAGTTSRFYWGEDLSYEAIDMHAWWRGNAMLTTEWHARSVGLLPPNPWGLHDMSGNAAEWCQDWHWFYFDGEQTDPVGPSFAEHRVFRGGSWLGTGGDCRSSRRTHEVPDMVRSDIGFRVVSAPPVAPAPGSPEISNVFVAGTDGVNTYRIPGMLVAPDKYLLVFCEARKESQDDASPTDMVLRRSIDGGRTWLPMQVLVRGKGKEALMNPCPVIDWTNNTIILVCDMANIISPNHHRHFQLVSTDNGATWSEPVEIKDRIANYDETFNPGPGVGIQMKSGRLVVPGYTGETNEQFEDNWHSRVLYSDDHGATWTLGAPVSPFSDECQAVELSDGTLMLNMRDNMGMSCRGVALSKDGGQTWTNSYWDRALNECPCQASIVRFSLAANGERDRLLFANPDNAGEKFNVVERTKMTIRMSYDEGKTWPVRRLIHAGPASYSSIVRLPDGDIGLLFEGGEKHRREWIRFVRYSLAWLTNGADTL